MDPSEGSIPLISVFRIRDFLCTDPNAYPGYFIVWGDYRCPRPGLDLLFFLQVGDTGSQPMRLPHFFIWRWDP